MRDPYPPGDRSPSESSPANRQVHAVLAWLVVEADVPNDVHLHLVEALVAWAPMMGEDLFPTEPAAGVDADLHQALEGMWWRLDAQAAAARADSVVLNEVRERISLAMQALRDEHPPALGQPVPRSPGG